MCKVRDGKTPKKSICKYYTLFHILRNRKSNVVYGQDLNWIISYLNIESEPITTSYIGKN